MSRPLRIQFPGAWYHVMNRGRHREKIVASKRDCTSFVDILEQGATLFQVQVMAWCLMPNHYHLFICTPDGNLARFMRHVDGVYTQYFNRQYGCDGQLFRGRYKAILVEPEYDSYVLGLIRYIHRNPLNAGLEKRLGVYPWSSWEAYMTRAKRWNWISTAPILSRFGETRRDQVAALQLFVGKKEEAGDIKDLIETGQQPLVAGSRKFLDWIRDTFFDLKHDQIPESRTLIPEQETIVAAVLKAYRCPERSLFQSQRGLVNEPRAVAIYLLRTLRGDTLLEIGSRFGLQRYSSVSSVIQKIRDKLTRDMKLQQRIAALTATIQKGQT